MSVEKIRKILKDLVLKHKITISDLSRKTGISRITLHNFIFKGTNPYYRTLDTLEEFVKEISDVFNKSLEKSKNNDDPK